MSVTDLLVFVLCAPVILLGFHALDRLVEQHRGRKQPPEGEKPRVTR